MEMTTLERDEIERLIDKHGPGQFLDGVAVIVGRRKDCTTEGLSEFDMLVNATHYMSKLFLENERLRNELSGLLQCKDTP